MVGEMKFDTNEEFCNWSERKREQQMLDDYFIKEEGEVDGMERND